MTSHAPPFPGGPTPPPHWPPHEPPRKRQWNTTAVVVTALVSALVGGAAATAVTGLVVTHHADASSTAGRQADAAVAPAAPALDAQTRTCDVLRAGYPQVLASVVQVKSFNSRPWTDPDLLAATNQLVDSMTKLADQLESTLDITTTSSVRTATQNLVAALRAVSFSQGNHVSDRELDGVGAFYNQVLDTPLIMCGIPRQ